MNDAITYSIVEIFDSVEGEGKRAGATATFIRHAGCNLRCSYCDTAHALQAEAGTTMTLEEILSLVNPAYKRVTLTGGEPLLAPGFDDLVKTLLNRGYEINVETNGSVDVTKLRKRVGESPNLFFTIDYKLPSSGESAKMLDENYFVLHKNDVLKFVVGSDEDVTAMIYLVERMQGNIINAIFAKKNKAPVMPKAPEMPQIFIGTVYGAFDLPRLADVIIKTPILKDARLQLQFHKIIWGPDRQGV
jgi:7-carboxy-7-deazaguanine synthase